MITILPGDKPRTISSYHEPRRSSTVRRGPAASFAQLELGPADWAADRTTASTVYSGFLMSVTWRTDFCTRIASKTLLRPDGRPLHSVRGGLTTLNLTINPIDRSWAAPALL